MSKLVRTLLAAALGAVALSASTGAFAHDRERHESYRGYGKGHYKHHHHDHRRYEVMRERVVIHEPPPVIYERRAYYSPPAIVIGFDIPPLVVPLH